MLTYQQVNAVYHINFLTS